MNRDIRPTEVDTYYSERVTHRIEIVHKETGLKVAGTGPNKYALECKLINILADKLEAKEKIDEVLK
jgi:hypothetical protein